MKLYNTIDDYLKEFKPNDKILLGGKGIMDGIKTSDRKEDTYKVHTNTTPQKIVIRAYRGKTNLIVGANSYDQQVAILTNEEYKDLK